MDYTHTSSCINLSAQHTCFNFKHDILETKSAYNLFAPTSYVLFHLPSGSTPTGNVLHCELRVQCQCSRYHRPRNKHIKTSNPYCWMHLRLQIMQRFKQNMIHQISSINIVNITLAKNHWLTLKRLEAKQQLKKPNICHTLQPWCHDSFLQLNTWGGSEGDATPPMEGKW